jgi:hypothetical protein
MPASNPPRTGVSGFSLAALALGLSLSVALPLGASAKTLPDPHHGWMHERGDGDSTQVIRVSGSGAVAVVQVCDGEVHVGTIAGGGEVAGLLAMGCDDPGDENAALSLTAAGAVAATTGGLALTAPAATAPSLGDLATVNTALAGDDGRDGPSGMGHGHHDGTMHHAPGVMDMGAAVGGEHAMAAPDDGGMSSEPARLKGTSSGEREARVLRAGRAGRGGGQRDAIGGDVSALPSTGSGLPMQAGDPLLALAVTIAAAGAAGGGFALRRRPVLA